MVSIKMNACVYGQMIFNKGATDVGWGMVSSINRAGKTGYPHGHE